MPQLRIPPHNIEAEQAVLGALMLDKDAIFQIVDYVFADDFYQPKHAIIYDAMRDLFTRNEPVDLLAVVNRLKEKKSLTEIGGKDYLMDLIDTTPSSSSVSYYGQIIKKKRLLRDLISASAHIGDLGYNEEREAEDILDEAEKRIFRITQRSVRQSFIELKNVLEEAFARIDKLSKGGDALRGVSTGFKDLDSILSGLQKSDLIMLAARPSLGKTTLALDIACNAALQQNVPVGIFSLEMSQDQLVDRVLASQSGVTLWKIRTGNLRDKDFGDLQQAFGTLSKAPIFIDDTNSASVLQIRAMARRLQSEKGLGLVIVDYIQLLESRAENRVQQVSEISRALKGLARELDIPVLVLSQLSRAIEHRGGEAKPKLSDLRESGCLAGDTSIMRADTGELVPIQNLVGQKDIPIFSLNEEQKIEVKTISNVFSSGRKKLFELKTRSGRTIKASANHPFLTIEGWQRLDKLEAGKHLAITFISEQKRNFAFASTTVFSSSYSPLLQTKNISLLYSPYMANKIHWDEIVSIAPLGVEKVFDATVPDTHSFVANDFIVHNSLEQDADVVLFIHREDKINEQSKRKNIADIIIAKHRNGPTGQISLYFNGKAVRFEALDTDHKDMAAPQSDDFFETLEESAN